MANVFDVAQYILRSFDEKISTMKLQKLCYYSQAWSLVWDEKPLFDEDIQAWINGPVVPKLFHAHKGIFAIGPDDLEAGDMDALTQDERETIDAVLDAYGGLSGTRLSEMTHDELPWQQARGDCPPMGYSDAVIKLDSMAEFYCAAAQA